VILHYADVDIITNRIASEFSPLAAHQIFLQIAELDTAPFALILMFRLVKITFA
jgi:hypothetical protein